MRHTLLVLTVLATVASAPLTALRGTGDTDAVQMFRIVHDDIATEVTPSAHALSARATMQVRPSSAGLRSLRLYLHKEFTVRRATEGGRVLSVTRPAGGDDRPMFSPSAAPIDIDLAREVRENEELTLDLAYDGPITGVINGVNLISPSPTEQGLYSAWFPIEKAGDAFTYGLKLTLPAGSVAVTDGRLIETTTSGDSTTYVVHGPNMDALPVLIPASSIEQAGAPLPKDVPLAVLLDRTWAGFEKQFVEAADAMPEDKFDFKPGGPLFTEVRTFGEQVRHFGAALYYNAAQQLGEPPPVDIEGQSGPDGVTGKAEIMKYLQGGFQYMRRAVSTMTNENATTIVRTPDRVGTRLLFAMLAAQHCGDHYGQMVVSLRMNGIVPPASRQPH